MRSAFDWTEMGWVSETLKLSGDVVLRCVLKKRGRLCVKKSNDGKGRWPKVLMTPNAGPEFRITVYGETAGKYIQVVTSEEPEVLEVHEI